MHEILSKIIALLTVAIFITDGANAETEIKRAQYLLKNLGYNIGFIDGIWGNKSEKAITEFFEKNEIYWDGQIDKKEVEILEKYSKPQTSSKKPLLAKVDKERKSNQLYSLSAFEKDVDYFSDTTLIKLLSANNNFQVLEMFAKNEDVFLNIVGSLELLLAVYLADPSEANSDILKRQYMILFDSGFASKLKGKNNDDGMLLEGFLIGLIYAFDTLSNNNNLHFDEKIRFDVEVRKRFNILKTYMDNHYTMSSCILGQSDAELFECQNHTYHKQLNRTAYGYVFDSKKDFAMGEKLFKFAIDDLKSDGALWREASRGSWSWHYYSLTLGFLLSIADIYDRAGIDLYSYKSQVSGKTIHDAVAFLLTAITAKENMWKYAVNIQGVEHYPNFRDFKSDEHLNKLIGKKGYGVKNWVYNYRYKFPDHPNTKKAEKLIPLFNKKMLGTLDLGINYQVLYQTDLDADYFISQVGFSEHFNSCASADCWHLVTLDIPEALEVNALNSHKFIIEYYQTNQSDTKVDQPAFFITLKQQGLVFENDLYGKKDLLIEMNDLIGKTVKLLIHYNVSKSDEGFFYVYVNGNNHAKLRWQGATLKNVKANQLTTGFWKNENTIWSSLQPIQIFSGPNECPELELESHNFDCSQITQNETNIGFFSQTCDGKLCPAKYDRSQSGLEKRFVCLFKSAEEQNLNQLPLESEIKNLINNLRESKAYINKRELVKMGLPDLSVSVNKAIFLRLVNFEGTNEQFCLKPIL